MDLDQLQSVRDRERQTDKLQQLRDSFYEDATAFVRDLRAERERAAREAEDPFDAPEVSRLTDQIRTAEQTIESIYEKRVGKLVKAATFAAADLPAEADGMTDEEADLFETMVGEIQANRKRVLGRLTGEGGAGGEDDGSDSGTFPGAEDGQPAGPASPDTTEDAPAEGPEAASEDGPGSEPRPPGSGPPGDGFNSPEPDADSAEDEEAEMSAADVMQGDVADSSPSDGPAADTEQEDVAEDDGNGSESDDVDRELVRITDDVGAIFGVDEREYELAKDDVVSLPVENARPLLERDAAERL